MISIINLSMQFGGKPIFDDVSFQIKPTDKIGLVGRNGAGKSTLLKIINGLLTPEKGGIEYPKGYTIGYLPQDIDSTSTKTVLNETRSAFEDLKAIETENADIQNQLAERTDYESKGYMKLIEKLGENETKLQLLGASNLEENIERILKGLGFEHTDLDRKMSEFSGGWQMRVELAKILLLKPDLLLLDEPTNHLDIESITWLEDFLKEYEGSMMLISHDRAFLDNITTRTVEVRLGKVEDYKVNYSKYMEMRKERRESQISAKKNQDNVVKQLEVNIEKFRYKKNKAKFAQSLIKRLEKMERIEVDVEDNSSLRISFPPPPRSGKVVVKADNLAKAYGEKLVIKNETFDINRGEHVAFVGKNGTGKTTLSRIVAGDLDFTGNFEIGHNVSIGYYAQHQAESLGEDKTVFQVIDDAATGDMRTKVRSLLGAFLFSGDDVDKKVKVLSGGERSRLALAKLLLEPVNLLILDEPTNHLDMVAKGMLKEALLQFEGTLIVVSHDRDFLQGLTKKVFEFTHKGMKHHIGDVYAFLESRKVDDFRGLELRQLSGQETQKKEKKESENKKQFVQSKQSAKELRKLKADVRSSEKQVGSLERKLARIEEQLRDSEEYKKVMNEPDFFTKYEALKEELTAAMQAWERAMLELEEATE